MTDSARTARNAAESGSAAREESIAISEIQAGNKRAVARLFNLLEDRRSSKVRECSELLDQLYSASIHKSHVLGITGPPGAGKSCLISRLIGEARKRGKTVGVIAIDPSSRRSRGAILGDRIRYDYDVSDAGVFVRSMANRGELGGVSDRTFAGAIVLRSAFDLVLVETVGVGQAESDVMDLADTTLFVVQPGSGDVLQFLKAGIMEEPDLMVVNKADQPQARRTLNDVRSALHTAHAGDGAWQSEALLASAIEGKGISEILDEAGRHRKHLVERGELNLRRHRQARQWLVHSLERLYGARGLEALGGADRLAEATLPEISTAPFAALDRLDREIQLEVKTE